MLYLGYDTYILNVALQQLPWSALGMHKTAPVNSPTWLGDGGDHGPLPLPVECLPVNGF